MVCRYWYKDIGVRYENETPENEIPSPPEMNQIGTMWNNLVKKWKRKISCKISMDRNKPRGRETLRSRRRSRFIYGERGRQKRRRYVGEIRKTSPDVGPSSYEPSLRRVLPLRLPGNEGSQKEWVRNVCIIEEKANGPQDNRWESADVSGAGQCNSLTVAEIKEAELTNV